MIDSDRLFTYLSTVEKDLHPNLLELKKKSMDDNVPIIGKGVEQLLITLMELIKPKRILELGTAYGFSALLMSTYDNNLEKLITIENYKKRIPIAQENIRKYGYEDKILLMEGDARNLIKSFSQNQFDFIFMDASKGQYDVIWDDVKLLVKPGGVVLTDDIMPGGNILESSFAITRRNRTIHKRMRSFLLKQLKDEEFSGTFLSIDDGVTLLVKKEKINE